MARPNGSNSGVDFSALLAQSKERQQRLNELAKQHGDIQKRRQQLDREEAEFMKEVQSLGLGGTFAPSRPARQPKNDGNKNKGKKGDDKPQQRQQKPQKRQSNGNGANGNGGQRGPSLYSVLLTVLPNSTEDGITKDEIAKRVAGEGYKSAAANPKVVIGQTLGGSNHFKNVGRGVWRLSKLGERARDKMFANAVNTASQGDTGTPPQSATPAQQQDAQPAVNSPDDAEARLAQTNAAAQPA